MKSNTSATLYSRSIVNGSEVWTRSEIAEVFWQDRKAANVIASGLIEADRAVVFIPGVTTSIKPADVLVKGAVTKVISSSYTMTELRAEFDTIVVRSVDKADFGSSFMQHLEVSGS